MVASEALKAGDYGRAADIYATVVRPAYVKAGAAADALRVYYAESGREVFDSAQRTQESTALLMVGLAVLVACFVARGATLGAAKACAAWSFLFTSATCLSKAVT